MFYDAAIGQTQVTFCCVLGSRGTSVTEDTSAVGAADAAESFPSRAPGIGGRGFKFPAYPPFAVARGDVSAPASQPAFWKMGGPGTATAIE